MVAAGKIELLVVDPPRHVDVVAADAVLVVRNVVHHFGNEAPDVGPGGIGEILPDDSARVCEAVRKLRRLRVEHQARGLARARGKHDHARISVPLGAALRIDVRHAAGEPAIVQRDFAGHRVGDERQSSRLERRRDQHIGRREIRVRLAAAAALPAVVTRHSAIVRLRDHREARGNAPDVEPVGRVLHHQLVAARRWRRQKIAARMVRQIVVVAEDSDQLVDAIVVGSEIRVCDRPVVTQPIATLRPEILGAEAKRDAPPVIGASTDHSRAPPPEVGALGVGERLAREVPPADAAVEFAEGMIRR